MIIKAIKQIAEDINTIYKNDPAATNLFEVIFCYPGLHALVAHRISHKLRYWKIPFIPRLISQIMRFFTGIEIHPGATIGRRLFIDHGMGIVIGETTIIGDDVLLFQQVTLGGTSMTHGKRHPTIENNVVVGAGAKILGDITIGKDSRIGAGSVVISDVPEGSTVVGIPGKIVQQRVLVDGQLLHNKIPDPVSDCISILETEINNIKEEINSIKNSQ